jgi:biotin operon repressor
MKAMTSQAIHGKEDHLCLKEPSGWFVAGASFRRALRTLSDGAFKLFAHLCLEADRRTGCFEGVQGELAEAIGKSRRIVGKYIEELKYKKVCTVRSGRNQYARTCFEIRDEYWPYRRTQEVDDTNGQVRNAYVDAIKSSFLAIGCTIGKFSVRDDQFAQDLQQRGIPLEIVQDALLIGATRKYISWLNGGSPQPIGSLAYFAALVSEIQERPLAADYREYLRRKVAQFERAWAKKSVKDLKNGGCLDMPCREIVQ